MTENLHIERFAGLRDAELELRNINIMIGPQATGKSICAKLIFFFKSFVSQLWSSVEEQQDKRTFKRQLVERFNDYFPPDSLLKGPYSAKYTLDNSWISVSRAAGPKAKAKVDFSKDFWRLQTWAKRNMSKVLQQDGESRRQPLWHSSFRMAREFHRRVGSEIGSLATNGQYFVPAGRSFFSILQTSIFSFLSSNNSIDPFVARFGSLYESFKPHRGYNLYEDEGTGNVKKARQRLKRMAESILSGKHEVIRQKDYIVAEDGRRVPLATASSGQQEILPLANILYTLPFLNISPTTGSTICIEEPEAHLFPTAQRTIVQMLALVYNEAPRGVQYIVTTHSPYILTVFNNLMQAHLAAARVADEYKSNLDSLVPSNLRIRPEDVRAYSLGGGTVRSICCKETGLITTNVIDEVSHKLAVEFGTLLDFEESTE